MAAATVVLRGKTVKPDLQELRQQAREARRLAMRKQARITRETGVESLGKYAPKIPDIDRIDRYNTRQLESFIKRSEQFRSRKTQFTVLGEKQVIPRERWKQFERVQQERVKQKTEAFDSVKDVYIPRLGTTIGQRREQVRPARARQMISDINFSDDMVTPERVTSLEALKKLEKKMKDMNAGTEQERARKQAMKSLRAAAEVVDNPAFGKVNKQLEQLTTDQFYVFWSIADSASAYFELYESLKYLESDDVSATKNDLFTRTSGVAAEKLQDFIDVAREVEGNGRRF